MSDAVGEVLLKTLLTVFDEPEEKKAVKSLVRNFEKTIHTLMDAPEPFKAEIEELKVERDFYRDQYEQMSDRLTKLQSRL